MRVLLIVLMGLLTGCVAEDYYDYGHITEVNQYLSNRCLCKITVRTHYTMNTVTKIWIECPCESVVGQTLMTYPMGEEPKESL